MRKRRNWLPLLAVLVMAVLAMTTGAFAAGEEAAEYISPFHATAWSLLPPVIAIGLALITKEVYSSLFIGILVGGLLYSNFAFEGTLVHVLSLIHISCLFHKIVRTAPAGCAGYID